MEGDGNGFNSLEDKEELARLEKGRRTLLKEREDAWRLKSRAIWLNCGDENTKFFQAYARGQNMTNII